MGSEDDSIEQAVASRRERLLALRAAQELSNASEPEDPSSHPNDNDNNAHDDNHDDAIDDQDQTPVVEDDQQQYASFIYIYIICFSQTFLFF